MRFAVAGNPVSHSLSPALFKAAYGDSRDTYGLLEADSAAEVMRRFHDGCYDGINVTAPFKESILEYVDVRSDLDLSLNAANTIYIRDGKLHSFNSDFAGVQECIRKFTVEGSNAVILGCGGAGKAAALAAAGLGCKVTVVNRTPGKATDFARAFSLAAGRIEQLPSIIKSSSLIINTLPSSIEVLDGLDYSGKTILEANYKSPQLQFTEKHKGANYISGKYWLLYQAIQSFTIFTGIEPDVKSMLLLIDNI